MFAALTNIEPSFTARVSWYVQCRQRSLTLLDTYNANCTDLLSSQQAQRGLAFELALQHSRQWMPYSIVIEFHCTRVCV